MTDEPAHERRAGRSRLVYDKDARTIVTVTDETESRSPKRLDAWQRMREHLHREGKTVVPGGITFGVDPARGPDATVFTRLEGMEQRVMSTTIGWTCGHTTDHEGGDVPTRCPKCEAIEELVRPPEPAPGGTLRISYSGEPDAPGTVLDDVTFVRDYGSERPQRIRTHLPSARWRELDAKQTQEEATELRPPLEHADKALHWVWQHDNGMPQCWTWIADRSAWMWCDPDVEDRINGFSGSGDCTGAQDAYADGYRYLGPAEWVQPNEPGEVTERMLVAGREAIRGMGSNDFIPSDIGSVYLAMDAAKPIQRGVIDRDLFGMVCTERDVALARVADLEEENARLLGRLGAQDVQADLMGAGDSWGSAYRVANQKLKTAEEYAVKLEARVKAAVDGQLACAARAVDLEAEVALLRSHPVIVAIPAYGPIVGEHLPVKADIPHDPKPAPDRIGPDDAAHRSVRETIEHLQAGRVTSAPARKALRDATDKADAPPTGRAAADAGLGRAIRFGGV